MNTAIQLTLLVLTLCTISECNYVIPRPCPVNEHFTTCVNDCPTPVCSDPRPPSCQSLVCNAGCECNRGFVRIKKPNGTCIPIANCINCLRRDFAFNECGSRCNNTCEQILSGQNICPAVCEPGCYCRKGVFDRYLNRCIPPKQCVRRPWKLSRRTEFSFDP